MGGVGVCILYVTAASYCTVALNQVDLARRRRCLFDVVRVGVESVGYCLCSVSAGPGCFV